MTSVALSTAPFCFGNTPPAILAPSPPYIPHDLLYTSPDTMVSINLTLSDPDSSMLGISCALLIQTPGTSVEVTIRGATAEANVQWLPTEAQEGIHILCFVATDRCQAKSLPTCLVVIVTREFGEV